MPRLRLYVLKVKSSTKIPHFVQIRNARFELIDYVRLDRPFSNLQKYGLCAPAQKKSFIEFVSRIPFGQVAEWSTRL